MRVGGVFFGVANLTEPCDVFGEAKGLVSGVPGQSPVDNRAEVFEQMAGAMLDAIPGLERLEPAEQEICCGSAGIYNIVQSATAAELGDRKAAHVLATEPVDELSRALEQERAERL